MVVIDDEIRDAVGLVEGSQVYSTLFKYGEEGVKSHEMILSTYAPENYRTLAKITFHIRDHPGSTAQAAKFLADRGINILNSISMNVISELGIVWKMLADLGFTGGAELIRDDFQELSRKNDPTVSMLDHIEVQSSDLGRIFSRSSASSLGGKTEQTRGGPMRLENGGLDLARDYEDYLEELKNCTVMVVAVPESWLLSLTFLRPEALLLGMRFSIPDTPGSIYRVTELLAAERLNLVSVFTKVIVSHEKMTMEIVTDAGAHRDAVDELRVSIEAALDALKGPYSLEDFGPI